MTMALIACWRKLLVLCNLLRQKKSLAGGVNNLALNHQPSLKPCHSKRRNSYYCNINPTLSTIIGQQMVDCNNSIMLNFYQWLSQPQHLTKFGRGHKIKKQQGLKISIMLSFVNDLHDLNTNYNPKQETRFHNIRVWNFDGFGAKGLYIWVGFGDNLLVGIGNQCFEW